MFFVRLSCLSVGFLQELICFCFTLIRSICLVNSHVCRIRPLCSQIEEGRRHTKNAHHDLSGVGGALLVRPLADLYSVHVYTMFEGK